MACALSEVHARLACTAKQWQWLHCGCVRWGARLAAAWWLHVQHKRAPAARCTCTSPRVLLVCSACAQPRRVCVCVAEGADAMTLRGVQLAQTPIGLLCHAESMDHCEVGKAFKRPACPVWVTYMESHYTVVFSVDRAGPPEDNSDFDVTAAPPVAATCHCHVATAMLRMYHPHPFNLGAPPPSPRAPALLLRRAGQSRRAYTADGQAFPAGQDLKEQVRPRPSP